jgi:hypothetical protein
MRPLGKAVPDLSMVSHKLIVMVLQGAQALATFVLVYEFRIVWLAQVDQPHLEGLV